MTERQLLADLLEATGAGRKRLRLAAACGMLASLAAVVLLGLSGWFLASAAIAGAAGMAAAQAFNYLIPSATIRLMAILRTAGRYGERLLGHQAALQGMAVLRTRLFSRRAAEDSRTQTDSPRTASAVLLDDIAALEDIVIRRPAVIAGLAGGVASVALVAVAGWAAALLQAAVLTALPLLLRQLVTRLTAAPSAQLANDTIALRAVLTDYFAARAEVAAYGLTPQVMEAIAPVQQQFEASKTRLLQGEALIAAVLGGYMALSVAGVLLLAHGADAPTLALALLASAAGVEAMTGFARNAMRKAGIETSLERLGQLSQSTRTAQVFARREAQPAAIGLGEATFAPGERIAITGASGSGKTQLVEALAGLRAPAHALFLDGTPLDDVEADSLRRQFALVPQDPMLLMGTVADNLRIAAPSLDERAMQEALEVACLDRRMAQAPDGLDTWLTPDGGLLSGGERKRLALARALLAGRPWLLLDEPTEGLDAATEQAVVERLEHWLDRTGTGLILVSHRQAPTSLASRELQIESVARR